MNDADWHRFREARSDIEQDLADSIDAAAAEGEVTGPVPVHIVRVITEALEQEWRSA